MGDEHLCPTDSPDGMWYHRTFVTLRGPIFQHDPTGTSVEPPTDSQRLRDTRLQVNSRKSSLMSDLRKNAAVINAARFTKRVNTLLKASSSVDASLLTQLKASISVLSRQQMCSGADKQQLVELEQLRNLANAAVPITASGRRGNQGREETSEAEAGVGKEEKILGFPEKTGTKKISVHSSSSVKNSGVGKLRQNLAAGEETHNAHSQDTTSAEKIQSLLQQSKDISAQELEQEQHKHDQLLGQVGELVGSLKEATLLMSKLVVEHNAQLDEITEVAGENMAELGDQREKMKETAKEMSTSIWTTVGTLFWLMSMFVVTYVAMRMFPKPAPW